MLRKTTNAPEKNLSSQERLLQYFNLKFTRGIRSIYGEGTYIINLKGRLSIF